MVWREEEAAQTLHDNWATMVCISLPHHNMGGYWKWLVLGLVLGLGMRLHRYKKAYCPLPLSTKANLAPGPEFLRRREEEANIEFLNRHLCLLKLNLWFIFLPSIACAGQQHSIVSTYFIPCTRTRPPSNFKLKIRLQRISNSCSKIVSVSGAPTCRFMSTFGNHRQNRNTAFLASSYAA